MSLQDFIYGLHHTTVIKEQSPKNTQEQSKNTQEPSKTTQEQSKNTQEQSKKTQEPSKIEKAMSDVLVIPLPTQSIINHHDGSKTTKFTYPDNSVLLVGPGSKVIQIGSGGNECLAYKAHSMFKGLYNAGFGDESTDG